MQTNFPLFNIADRVECCHFPNEKSRWLARNILFKKHFSRSTLCMHIDKHTEVMLAKRHLYVDTVDKNQKNLNIFHFFFSLYLSFFFII